MSQAELQLQIILLSNAKTWDEAKLEWTLKDIQWSDDPQTCLCGHFPIKEICLIENRLNRKTTEVGNCCVNRFLGIDSKQVFASIRKVRKTPGTMFNEAAIRLAHQLGIIDDRDQEFDLNICGKRGELSEKQLKWRNDLNRRMMARFVKPQAKNP